MNKKEEFEKNWFLFTYWKYAYIKQKTVIFSKKKKETQFIKYKPNLTDFYIDYFK